MIWILVASTLGAIAVYAFFEGEKDNPPMMIFTKGALVVTFAFFALSIVNLLFFGSGTEELVITSEIVADDRDVDVDFDDVNRVTVVTDAEFYIEKQSVLKCSEAVRSYYLLVWGFTPTNLIGESLIVHVPPDV
jgi:hypothetical protein